MKHLFFIFITSLILFTPFLSFAACWQSDEISRIEGFSELDEKIVFSFKDAVNCTPLEGVNVTMAGQSFTTDGKGYLVLPVEAFEDLEDDEILLQAQMKGYINLKTTVRARIGTVLDKRFLMSKDLPIESARFVLQWDIDPQDLDLHLVAPNFHISFRHKRHVPKKAKLDTDAMRGYGPETITIEKVGNSDKYELYVDNFSVGEDINNEATVTVYMNNKQDRVVRLPDTAYRAVKILQIENGQITYINKPVRKVK